jgi:hypothetical protein
MPIYTITLAGKELWLEQKCATDGFPNFKQNSGQDIGYFNLDGPKRYRYLSNVDPSQPGNRSVFNQFASAIIALNDGDTNSRTIDP